MRQKFVTISLLYNGKIKLLILFGLWLLYFQLNASISDYSMSQTWIDNSYPWVVDTTFFHHKNYYLMETSCVPNKITRLWKCDFDKDGQLNNPVLVWSKALDKTNPYTGARMRKSSVIYRGDVYIFYSGDDIPLYKTKKVYYMKSGTPEIPESWSSPIEVEVTNNSCAIQATVFNDKIYLFNSVETEDCYQLHFTCFDGKNWEKQQFLDVDNIQLHSQHFFVTTGINRSGKEMLFMGCVLKRQNDTLFVYNIESDNQIRLINSQKLDWCFNESPILAFAGSVVTGKQDCMLQIFAPNGYGFNNDLKQCEMDIQTGAFSGWRGTGIVVRYITDPFPDFNITEASLSDTKGNFQRYLIINSKHWQFGPVCMYTFKSDVFLKTSESEQLYTGDAKTLEKGTWSVLGVVEGVPPFTRNGVQSSGPTSSVLFGKSETMMFSTEIKYDLTLSLSGSWSDKDVGEAGASLKYGIGFANKIGETIAKSFTIKLSNVQGNSDGKYGWLIVSKPTLKGYTYIRVPANDGNISLGKLYVIAVIDTSITFEPYLLSAPPEGMKIHMPSTEIKSWVENLPCPYTGIDIVELNILKTDDKGGSSTVEVFYSKEVMNSKSTTINLSLSALSAYKLVGAGAGVSYDSRSSVSTTVKRNILLSLAELPNSATPHVSSITVQPVLYVPEPDTILNNMEEKPYWIPKEYTKDNLIPWCLSWRVLEIKESDKFIIKR